jgi:hypothetical protein
MTTEQSGAVAEAAGKAREVASEQVSEATERARGGLRTQVDQRSRQAGEQLATLAGAVRQASDQLRSQDQHGPARIGDQLADRGEQAAAYLRERDGETILADAEQFAREQPWLVAGAGVLAGLVAARALKASSRRRYAELGADGSDWTAAAAGGSTGARRWPAHEELPTDEIVVPARSGEG